MASATHHMSVTPSQLGELSAIMRALAHERKDAAFALRRMAEEYEIAATGGAMAESLRGPRLG